MPFSDFVHIIHGQEMSILFSGGNFLSCKNNTLSAREVAQFLCKRVIANEGFEDIEKEGKLVCVGRDFIAIKTDDREVFYLPLNNVRNISVVSDRSCCNNDRKKVCNDTFQSILRKLINCKVEVNDGGDNDNIRGILTVVNRNSIQIVEEESLNIVKIPIGSINFITQSGELGDDESSNCRILCCKKENPCGKKKHDCKKESSSKCCKKESSSSSTILWCKKESSSSSSSCSSSSSSSIWCKKESSSSSSSSSEHCKKKKKKMHDKKRCCADLESKGWFKL
jgi:hypothetical protein